MFSKPPSGFGISAGMAKKLVLGVLVLVLVTDSFVFAGEAAPKSANKNYAKRPFCGLYCLYSILKLDGREIDFRSLVKPEYLGSRKGSSLEELRQASEDFGLNSVALSRLTPGALKHITVPTILHVKSSNEQKDYDHFVLYLGSKDGKARIFDPPAEQALVEFGSLASKWDGNALVISAKPLTANAITSLPRRRLAVYAGFVIFGVLTFYALKRLLPMVRSPYFRIGLSIGQAAGLVMIAVFFGLLCHYFYNGGFFANAPAVKGVQKSHAGNFVPKVTPRKMQKVAAGNNVVILDARLKRDYEAGCIKGAISLPINCSDDVYAETVSRLAKDNQIILYCQSAGCQYAEKIAVRLKEDGFEDLAVFKGGWVEWQKVNESQSAKTEGPQDEKNV